MGAATAVAWSPWQEFMPVPVKAVAGVAIAAIAAVAAIRSFVDELRKNRKD
ncbi:hypothetical protein BC793_104130 [Actinoplanes xinjiangensis]|uniref:Uncharacterized protein n=1 Tax=Actinoplanes xinjiangensis TaxID=512350 RepID=A0A316G4W6_9ACTN|nr:hypothetical protein BC793_104130 [Actinoplanes xinjiangensis]